jgi:sugar lactone lactonase YvrE
VLKGNHRTADRRPRPVRSLGTAILTLSMAAFVPAMLPGAAAEAATGAAGPVAGVLAFGIGAGQLGSSGGGSQSNSPTGVAFDGKGDLFAADPTNNRVVEYTPSSPTSYPRTGTVVAGTGGAGSGLSQLSGPNGVAVDAAGDLFVADSLNNRVVEYAYNAATGSYPAAGKVVAGTGTAGSGLTQLSDPQGIALDASGDLFVADYGNNRVEEFAYNSATGSYASTATTVAGTGTAGSGNNQLAAPSSVTLDAKGDLFIADAHNERVMEYAYNSSAGSYAASGTQIGGALSNLAGWVTLDASGDLFVSYGYLGYGGVLEFPYNSVTGSYASSGTAVASADQVGPSGLAFNPSGDLFIGETAQTNNPSQTVWDAVLEFTYNALSGAWSPTGTVMSQSGRMNMGVSSIAVDSHGDLFASDGPVYEFPYNSAGASYSAQGTQIATAGSVLALDGSNDLFVASTGTAGVLEYPWNASSGSYAGSGQAVPGAAQLATLTVGAMALDAKNDLFVATGSQVLEFPYNASSGTYAASGTVIATVAAGGLALDSSGDLFVSNPATSRVQEYLFNSATGSYASGITVAGSGGTGSGASQLSGPTGVAVDHSGDLFVFDAGNARVMEFTGNQATGAYAANGTAVFTGSRDNYPETGGVALDPQGDVFFSYNYSSAVVYEAAGSASPPPPAPAVTGVSPSTGPAAGGTAVTVSGSSLTGGSVTFGTAAATGVSCSATSCTATSPAGTGTVNVTVTSPGGTSATSTADQFTYSTTPPPAPVVTGVSPSTGPAAGGTAVTVSGSSLTGGSVTFGTAAATGVSCSATSCTATSPAGTGTVNVTVTTPGGTSATSTADQFTYSTTPPPANLIPNPGFESAGVPSDYWGSSLARSQAVAHSGSWSLAQTLKSSSGGWDLDSNPSWYAPISSAKSYTAGIWVRSTATVKVNLSLDLLDSGGNYVDSASGPNVTLAANTWTHLTLTGIRPASGEVYGGMEPDFLSGTKGTVIYWDDMTLTSP